MAEPEPEPEPDLVLRASLLRQFQRNQRLVVQRMRRNPWIKELRAAKFVAEMTGDDASIMAFRRQFAAFQAGRWAEQPKVAKAAKLTRE